MANPDICPYKQWIEQCDIEDMEKLPRLCEICGARVTNINPKVTTCDKTCQMAKDAGTDRTRMMRIIEQRCNDGLRIHPSFGNRGSRVEDRTVE